MHFTAAVAVPFLLFLNPAVSAPTHHSNSIQPLADALAKHNARDIIATDGANAASATDFAAELKNDLPKLLNAKPALEQLVREASGSGVNNGKVRDRLEALYHTLPDFPAASLHKTRNLSPRQPFDDDNLLPFPIEEIICDAYFDPGWLHDLCTWYFAFSVDLGDLIRHLDADDITPTELHDRLVALIDSMPSDSGVDLQRRGSPSSDMLFSFGFCDLFAGPFKDLCNWIADQLAFTAELSTALKSGPITQSQALELLQTLIATVPDLPDDTLQQLLEWTDHPFAPIPAVPNPTSPPATSPTAQPLHRRASTPSEVPFSFGFCDLFSFPFKQLCDWVADQLAFTLELSEALESGSMTQSQALDAFETLIAKFSAEIPDEAMEQLVDWVNSQSVPSGSAPVATAVQQGQHSGLGGGPPAVNGPRLHRREKDA